MTTPRTESFEECQKWYWESKWNTPDFGNLALPGEVLDAWNASRIDAEKKIEFLEEAGSEMSARLSYLDRLVKEYETIINRETQIRIRKYIFSEDDR